MRHARQEAALQDDSEVPSMGGRNVDLAEVLATAPSGRPEYLHASLAPVVPPVNVGVDDSGIEDHEL
jgi:hypothetical protein